MKTFVFALVLSLLCSSILAFVSAVCQPRYQENRIFEARVNTLQVLGLHPGEGATREEVDKAYSENIKELEMSAKTPEGGETTLPVFVNEKSGVLQGVAFPISGKGLWGPIRGMAALKGDLKTIMGARFFDHQETPGLGAEIDKPWFYEQWSDRPAVDDEGRVVIRVVGPKASTGPNEIDGISGASITSQAITKIMQNGIRVFLDNYKPAMVQAQ
jgi:Na+-transporting NADH:ubiquinone oxidoreductase subunit C